MRDSNSGYIGKGSGGGEGREGGRENHMIR